MTKSVSKEVIRCQSSLREATGSTAAGHGGLGAVDMSRDDVSSPHLEDDHGDDHPHGRCGEGEIVAMIADADEGGGQRRQGRSEVHPHVEDVERGVLELAAFLVQVADEHGNIGLEQPGSHGDQNQARIEQGDPCERGEGQGDVAEHHQDRPQPDRVTLAEDAVAEESSQHGDEIDHCPESSRNSRLSLLSSHPRLSSMYKVEDGHQRVEAEALPHLGEEQTP